jgi:deoxyhypusine synthase
LRELTFEFHQKKQLATLTVDVVKMTDQNISAIFKQGRNLGLKIGGGGGWTHFARQKGVVKNATPTLSIYFIYYS